MENKNVNIFKSIREQAKTEKFQFREGILYHKKKKMFWEEQKENYAHSNKGKMKELHRYRAFVISVLLKYVKKHYPDVSWQDSGSSNLTSDMDFNLVASKTSDKAGFMELFNTLFYGMFFYSSAEVFDVNIYGVAPVMDVKPTMNTLYVKKTKNKKNTVELYDIRVFEQYDDKNKILSEDYIRQQRAFSLAMLLKCNPEFFDRECYGDTLVKINNKKATHKGFNILQEDIRYALELNSQVHTGDITEMNAEVTKMMYELDKKSNALEDKDYDKEQHLEINKYLHRITQTQQGAYYSMGAFAHIVIQNQRQITDFHIYDSEYMDSMIENTGDAFKMIFNHSLHKSEKKLDKNHHMFSLLGMLEISKYIYRALEAASHCFKDYESNNKKFDFTKLLEHFRSVASVRGQKIENDVSILLEENLKNITQMLDIKPDTEHTWSNMVEKFRNTMLFLLSVHYGITCVDIKNYNKVR